MIDVYSGWVHYLVEVFQWSRAGHDWRTIPQRVGLGKAQNWSVWVHCFQTDSIVFGMFCADETVFQSSSHPNEEVWGLVLGCLVRNYGSWDVRPPHFCTWEEKLADVEVWLSWNVKLTGAKGREWGNGMIFGNCCGLFWSFSHSLLSNSKEMVSLDDLHIIT